LRRRIERRISRRILSEKRRDAADARNVDDAKIDPRCRREIVDEKRESFDRRRVVVLKKENELPSWLKNSYLRQRLAREKRSSLSDIPHVS
jgi:hypothetical protein